MTATPLTTEELSKMKEQLHSDFNAMALRGDCEIAAHLAVALLMTNDRLKEALNGDAAIPRPQTTAQKQPVHAN